MTPLYRHSCEYCTYLGSLEEHDLYVCDRHNSRVPSVLARYGCEPWEYMSSRCDYATLPLLREAVCRARQRGLTGRVSAIKPLRAALELKTGVLIQLVSARSLTTLSFRMLQLGDVLFDELQHMCDRRRREVQNYVERS